MDRNLPNVDRDRFLMFRGTTPKLLYPPPEEREFDDFAKAPPQFPSKMDVGDAGHPKRLGEGVQEPHGADVVDPFVKVVLDPRCAHVPGGADQVETLSFGRWV